METILSILTVLFIIALVVTALTFGVAMLIWFILFAMMVTGFVMLKHLWYRWRFTRMGNLHPHAGETPSQPSGGYRQQETSVKIIEVDFEDVPPEKR